MKKLKGKIIPSNQEILRRLDKIEEQSTFFNRFVIFSFALSMSIAVFAIYFATRSFNIFLGGYLLFILAAALMGILVGSIIASKFKRRSKL